MSKKRTYRSQAQWQKIIADFEQSGESVTGYCKQLGVSDNRFYIWRKKLAAEKHGISSAETFIEYLPQLRETPAEQTSFWDVELDLGDMVLRIRRS